MAGRVVERDPGDTSIICRYPTKRPCGNRTKSALPRPIFRKTGPPFRLGSIAKETTWIGQVHSQVLQEVNARVFNAYDGFFNLGKGFPKFARKGHYQSFSFRQGVKITPTHVQLPKFGFVKYRNSQDCVGQIKRATVQECADGWYVCLCVETDIAHLPVNENRIGIDVGIKSLLVTSDG